ncbi:MAG: ATP-dependent DNA helicase [Ignavibacteria bacterium]
MSSLKSFFSNFNLTQGQKDLIDKLDKFLQSDTFCFIIKGAAGTGKTFITKGVVDYLDSINREYHLAAPTGRAAKILANRTGKPASTIHRMIYSTTEIEEIKDEDSEATEEIKFYFKIRINNSNHDTVYIVDEASMVSDKYSDDVYLRFGSGRVLKDLITYIKYFDHKSKRKLILIGDECQLPPVNMSNSPALDKNYLSQTYDIAVDEFELTEIVRQQAESGILGNAFRIRDSLKRNTFSQIYIDSNDSDVQSVKPYEFDDVYFRILSGYNKNDTILIAYTNFQVYQYNNWVRENLWKGDKELKPGDRVVVVRNNYKYGLLNGEFLEITAVGDRQVITTTIKVKDVSNKVFDQKVELYFRDIKARIDYSDYEISAKMIENLIFSDEPTLKKEELKALYVDFKKRHSDLKTQSPQFKEALREDIWFNALQLKFGYAITCHKAQGGEWKNVFINCRSPVGYRNSNYFKWLYTAITRSKEKIYVINEPDFRIDTGIVLVGNIPLASYGKDVIILDKENLLMEIPFDFPTSPEIIKNIYYAVVDLIKDELISIERIKHYQYAEHYFFSNGDEEAFFIIYYNNNGKVSKVENKNCIISDWIKKIFELLKTLEGKKIIIKSDENEPLTGETDFEFPPDKPFLKEFYERIKQKVDSLGVRITCIEHKDYHEIYTFTKGSITTVVKFYYNGKGIFTKVEVIQTRSTGIVEGLLKLLLGKEE